MVSLKAKSIAIVLVVSLLIACRVKKQAERPKPPSAVKISYHYEGENLKVHLTNTIKAPIRYTIHSENQEIETIFRSIAPIKLLALQDTSIVIPIGKLKTAPVLSFKGLFGDPDRIIQKSPLALPFPKGKSYKVIQGYHGRFSHQSATSRFALDFSMKIGDTICAADNGLVIGIVGHNQKSGKTARYTDYANYITL